MHSRPMAVGTRSVAGGAVEVGLAADHVVVAATPTAATEEEGAGSAAAKMALKMRPGCSLEPARLAWEDRQATPFQHSAAAGCPSVPLTVAHQAAPWIGRQKAVRTTGPLVDGKNGKGHRGRQAVAETQT